MPRHSDAREEHARGGNPCEFFPEASRGAFTNDRQGFRGANLY